MPKPLCYGDWRMGTPKGTKPWNAGTSKGWTDTKGYRWRHVVVNGRNRKMREHRWIMEQHMGGLRGLLEAIEAAAPAKEPGI